MSFMRRMATLAASGAALGGLGLVGFTALTARKAEQMVPRDGRFLRVNDARIHYVDMGSGPPIVMIHGLYGQMRNLTYALAERLVKDHRVIVIDRPGCGYSTWTGAEDKGLRAQAAIIAQVIAALDLDRPLVVGHSMGGAVSLALALHAPDAVGGLALLAPLTQPVDEPGVFANLAIPSPAKREAVAWTLATPMSLRRAEEQQRFVFSPDTPPADFATRGGGALALRPSAFRAASSDLCHAKDDMEAISPRYGEITMPVGILFGEGDTLLDPMVHGTRTADALPNGELTVIEGGHMIPVTWPDKTAQWVLSQAKRISRE
ncbi:alpha/beta hydrolase [uncultured Croceicoccus sp.]|uniref:alpha/beta fold hydrolase n=1 Tax=uncultured Croceicoccus sp. TaxID=1295329 RepID=UPI0026084FE3|nr:alpha/beta hydrolase [uncultured Croceicoccus sp.]